MGYRRVQKDWLKKARHSFMKKGGAMRSKKHYNRKREKGFEIE